MMIVVEGPSLTGKTTLANDLSTELERYGLKFPVWSRPKEWDGVKKERNVYSLCVLDEMSIISLIDWRRNDIIVDRHPLISERVYRFLHTRKTHLDLAVDVAYDNNDWGQMVIIYLARLPDKGLPDLEARSYDRLMEDYNGTRCAVAFLRERTDGNVKRTLKFLQNEGVIP